MRSISFSQEDSSSIDEEFDYESFPPTTKECFNYGINFGMYGSSENTSFYARFLSGFSMVGLEDRKDFEVKFEYTGCIYNAVISGVSGSNLFLGIAWDTHDGHSMMIGVRFYDKDPGGYYDHHKFGAWKLTFAGVIDETLYESAEEEDNWVYGAKLMVVTAMFTFVTTSGLCKVRYNVSYEGTAKVTDQVEYLDEHTIEELKASGLRAEINAHVVDDQIYFVGINKVVLS